MELGYIPDRKSVQVAWSLLVLPFLEESGLTVQKEFAPIDFQRREHTKHLDRLLSEMQLVARMDPEAQW